MKESCFAIIRRAMGGVCASWLIACSINSPTLKTADYDLTQMPIIVGKVISPSGNDQSQPDIDGSKIVWSEKINGYWQIILFDLDTQARRQLTFDAINHETPRISGNLVVWQQGEPGGETQNGGIDLDTDQWLNFPQEATGSPALDAGSIVWVGPGTLITEPTYSVLAPIIYFDAPTGPITTVVTDTAPRWVNISDYLIVWTALNNGNDDIHAFDLKANQFLTVVSKNNDQTRPSVSDNMIVWQDNRSSSTAQYIHDIYGYDVENQVEFLISARKGDETSPQVEDNYVVWVDHYGNQVDIFGYDLNTQTPFAITSTNHLNGEPKLSGNKVVWTQLKEAHSYKNAVIMLGEILLP